MGSKRAEPTALDALEHIVHFAERGYRHYSQHAWSTYAPHTLSYGPALWRSVARRSVVG